MAHSTDSNADGNVLDFNKDKPVNILFLSASSGGGHNAVAQSLSGLIANVQDANFHTIDLYADKRLQPYTRAATMRAKAPWAWAGLLGCTDNRKSIDTLWRFFRPGFIQSLKQQVDNVPLETPDIIIATHHASAQCLASIAEHYSPSLPKTVVFVTDYDAHQNWIAEADLYVVASQKACQRLSKQGKRVIKAPLLPCTTYLSDQQVKATGSLRSPISKHRTRFKFVALMGLDGTSERKLKRLLNTLDKQSFSQKISIDVICGKNRHLQQQLQKLQWAHLDVNIFGYVNDVPQRLEQADLALLRLSPQIMTESLVVKTPVIAFDWHYHERENVQLLREFGAGDGSRYLNQQIQLIKQFCQNASLRRYWQDAAEQVSEQRISDEFIEEMFACIQEIPIAAVTERFNEDVMDEQLLRKTSGG